MAYLTNAHLGATSPKDPYQLIADDLALWLENMSTQIADAMKPQGLAPFAVQISDQQKILYYRNQIFNPDGTPNMQGRTEEMNRLGPAGFRMVYKAVVQAFPNLRIPAPPEGQSPMPLAAPPEASVGEENFPTPTGIPGGVRPIGRGHR
jgi:hypothetical protein